MSKKTPIEYIRIFAENKGYELISINYINANEKFTLKDDYNYYYSISWSNFSVGKNPQIVTPTNEFSIHNISNFMKLNNLNYNLLTEKYIGNDQELILCDDEGYYYSTSWRMIQRNSICSFVSSKNKYSTDNIKLFMKKNNINLTLINQYINNYDKLVLVDNNGYYYTQLWSNMNKLYKPSIVETNNEYSIQNIKLWCKLNNKPFELVSDTYENNSKKLKWKCLKPECGEIFENNWGNISQGQGCGYCTGKQVGSSNSLAVKNPNLAKEWHPIKNGELTPYDIMPNCSNKAWWLCPICENEWFAYIFNRNYHNRGCPKCSESKGEKQLDLILTQYNISHDSQYTFDDLRGIKGGLLRFDTPIFYDQDKIKLRMLIEYDGKQHYEWIEDWMTKEEFETIQIHDELKNQYCKNHNIKLLRIPYWDFDNIESILIDKLNLNLCLVN